MENQLTETENIGPAQMLRELSFIKSKPNFCYKVSDNSKH